MNDNPAGEVRPMIHRKPPNDTATWSASLRSRLWAASRAGPGRQTLASCGRPTHDWRSGAGKRGIPADTPESNGNQARLTRPTRHPCFGTVSAALLFNVLERKRFKAKSWSKSAGAIG